MLLYACSSPQPAVKPQAQVIIEIPEAAAPVSLESLLAQATAEKEAKRLGLAVDLLVAATETYPADKRPWLQMAQIHFDDADYGHAIDDALEALQRDPRDKLANSLLAISSLRLSTRALADLRQINQLSGPIDSEAKELAKVLRQNLGEIVLVPAHSSRYERESALKPNRKSVTLSAPAVDKPTVLESVPKGDVNPFSSLQ